MRGILLCKASSRFSDFISTRSEGEYYFYRYFEEFFDRAGYPAVPDTEIHESVVNRMRRVPIFCGFFVIRSSTPIRINSYLCHVLAGLFYILFCWALGNGVSLLIGGYLPGSIVGMILLFASLCLHIVDAEMIRPAARFLLGAMALFFIPYGVGLMVSYEVLLDNFWAIVISGGVSTMLVLVCVGRVFQKLNKKA